MLQLVSKDLLDNASDRLTYLQGRVDAELSFTLKAARASSLWDGKSSGQVGQAAFESIKTTLESMCVSVEICNYCEQNEANDIEHIYPKSLFPGMAFKWDNYLLACKQCNTAYKLDAFAVLDANDEIFDIPRGTEPPYLNGAFINPRTEDPSEFMLVNTLSFKFELLPDLDKKAKNKAVKTIEVLQLNERDTLVAARKAAATYYYERMERLVRILKASTIQEIKNILTPYDELVDESQSLETIKESIKQGFKKDIQAHQHPSVWHSIKIIDRMTNPKWDSIFDALPEAFHW